MKEAEYPKLFLGNSVYGLTWLYPPKWECDWYWSWGCIGNYHFSSHLKYIDKSTNLHDAIKGFLPEIPLSDKDLWTFAELVATFYSLREVADIHHRGGSHLSVNPLRELLQDKDRYEYINGTLIPAIFEETYKLFPAIYKEAYKLFEEKDA